MGCAVEMHIKPTAHGSFEAHSVSGFYTETYVEQYRFHQVWVKDTKSVRIGNTVFFKHKYLTMHTVTAADALLKAANDLM